MISILHCTCLLQTFLKKNMTTTNQDITIIEEFDEKTRMVASGQSLNGQKMGIWWFYNEDGGLLVGTLDAGGTLSGNNIAYMYPDCWTALVGQFEGNRMIRAKLARLVASSNRIPEFSIISTTNDEYKYDESTRDRISSNPLLPDPYESERVHVKPSTFPDANEGLFVKFEVGPGVVISFYNGVRLTHDEVDQRSWSENGYTMVLNDDVVLDVPFKYTKVVDYCATLGHKINHSFKPNCVTEKFLHPRFGAIIAIRTKQTIKSGAELTINYGYGPRTIGEEMDVPEWYTKQMKLYLE